MSARKKTSSSKASSSTKSQTPKKAQKKKAQKKNTQKKKAATKATKKALKKTVAKKKADKKPTKKRTAKQAANKKAAKKGGSPRAAKAKTSSRAKKGETSPLQPLLYRVVPPDRRFLAQVVVFGGGIAGLTAAHELADRGFQVVVIEPKRSINRRGREDLALGGMARTQYLRVPFETGARWWDQMEELQSPEVETQDKRWTALPAREVGARSDFGFYVTIEDPTAPLPEDVQETIRAHVDFMRAFSVAEENQGRPCPFLVVTPVLSGEPSELQQRRAAADSRVNLVRDFMREECNINPDLINEEIAGSMGPQLAERERVGMPPRDTPWVGVRLDQAVLPGEHGFRFFPSYYRHMFDTMHRIPLRDSEGFITESTAYNNIQSARIEAFAARGHMPTVTSRGADLSASQQMHTLLMQIRAGAFTSRDIKQFMSRILRYMCASPIRRSSEYENISWWQYLAAWDSELGINLLHYSKPFSESVKFSGKVLAAFDAEQGDAHTNGDTFIQLFLSQIYKHQSMVIDGTLNAPTTEALFKPWKEQLDSLGVTFLNGELDRLELEDGLLTPRVRWTDQDAEALRVEAEYFVVATDAVTAEKVTKGLPSVGVPEKLKGYTTVVYPGPHPKSPKVRYRNPYKQPGVTKWDRLQTLAGVQYFFPSDFKLVFGHIYFADAEWALSSITEQCFWRRRPSLASEGFTSLLSVDIGSWNSPGTKHVDHRHAWECNEMEIGIDTWRQIQEALRAVELGSPHGTIAMPQPTWFHIDTNIVFGKDGGTPVENRSPFLVPMVSDWKNRPGTIPWVPTGPNVPVQLMQEGVWQARHGGYPVHWDKLVFAGTYLKTKTRMTTMESANESARHAVNAIIDHYVNQVGPVNFASHALLDDTPDITADTSSDASQSKGAPGNDPLIASFVGTSFVGGTESSHRHLGDSGAPITSGTPGEQSPIYPTTWIGDYCQIWDPEEFEPPDLRPLRDLDGELCKAGLPHLFDVLGVDPVLKLARLGAKTGLTKALLDLEPVLRSQRPDPEAIVDFASGLTAARAKVQEAIRKQGAASGSRPQAGEGSTGSAFNPLDPFGVLDRLRDMTPGDPAGLAALLDALGLDGSNLENLDPASSTAVPKDPDMAAVHEAAEEAEAAYTAVSDAVQAAILEAGTAERAVDDGLEGWAQFQEFAAALGGSVSDAAETQAEVLRTLRRMRAELEKKMFDDSDET